jgi:putative CocE/NonD family hydrolase
MSDKADGPDNDWKAYVLHGPADPYWRELGYFRDESKINTPSLFINSWYDMSPHETMKMLNRFRENGQSKMARENQFAVIGPTGHCQGDTVTSNYSYGMRELGDPRKDYWSIYLRWFRYWLNDAGASIEMPRVQYYLMGSNEWRDADSWPLPETQFTEYYLHSRGNANGRFGDGELALHRPGSQAPDHFTYDPAEPVPSLGYNYPGGKASHDQSGIEMREDVLVYTTPPLDRGVEVTGPLKAVLFVESTARDTDFTAKLVDVYPDGRAFNIREGIARARYREGFDKTAWMEKGAIYEIEIDLQVTANFFGPGHRIRLEVSSSNFPRFERNLNTGDRNYDETSWSIARNIVYHDDQHQSYLLLPVIPASDSANSANKSPLD